MYKLRPRTSRSARSRRARSACIVTKSCTPQRNHTTCAAHNECKEDARTMQFVPSTEWASAVGIEKSGAGLIDAPRLLCSCTTRAQTHGRRRSSCAQAPLKGWTGVITRLVHRCYTPRSLPRTGNGHGEPLRPSPALLGFRDHYRFRVNCRNDRYVFTTGIARFSPVPDTR